MFFDKILDALKVENLFPKESNEELPDTSTFISTRAPSCATPGFI